MSGTGEPVAWRAIFPHGEAGPWHSMDPKDQYHRDGLVAEGVQLEYAYPPLATPCYLITKDASGQTVVTTTQDDLPDIRAFVESLELPKPTSFDPGRFGVMWQDANAIRAFAVQAITAWEARNASS